MTTIGYLGPEGTFTEQAVQILFPTLERKPFKTISLCMDGVADEKVDAAVVPIENAIEGSVNMTLDYLIHKRFVPIIAELTTPIKQHLLIHPNQEKEWLSVNKVVSHPQAIAQCHEFLREQLPSADIEYMNSTGTAAQFVKDHPDEKIAAIGNDIAAQKYGLRTVRRDIHDYENNHTRFIVIGKNVEVSQPSLYTGGKTTMMVTLSSDFSGALHQVLSAFAWRQLNLTKIESRPTKTGLGNYYFVIDVDQEMDDVLLPGVKSEIEALGCKVRILGSYPCFAMGNVKQGQQKPVPK